MVFASPAKIEDPGKVKRDNIAIVTRTPVLNMIRPFDERLFFNLKKGYYHFTSISANRRTSKKIYGCGIGCGILRHGK